MSKLKKVMDDKLAISEDLKKRLGNTNFFAAVKVNIFCLINKADINVAKIMEAGIATNTQLGLLQ
jgi:hypothetical protein